MPIPDISPRRRRWQLMAASVMTTASCGLSGCSSDSAAPRPDESDGAAAGQDAAPSTGPPVPIEDGGPLVDLPSCSPPPEGMDADVEGLLLPQGAVVTDVQDQGQLVNVRAYIEQTPIQVRQFYGERQGLELFEIEDEIYEAEVLYGEGDFRSYVKAQAQCQQGSLLIVFVGPGDSGVLPEVGGG